MVSRRLWVRVPSRTFFFSHSFYLHLSFFYKTCSQQEPNFISNAVESIIKCKQFKNNNIKYYKKSTHLLKKIIARTYQIFFFFKTKENFFTPVDSHSGRTL